LALIAWVAVAAWALWPAARALWPGGPALLAPVGALLLVFGTLESTPDLGQSLYWQTGMVTYLLPLVILTGYAGWLVRLALRQDDFRLPRLALLPAGLAPFVAGGFSETYAVFQVALLAAAVTGLFALAPSPLRARLLPVTIAGLVGAVVA